LSFPEILLSLKKNNNLFPLGPERMLTIDWITNLHDGIEWATTTFSFSYEWLDSLACLERIFERCKNQFPYKNALSVVVQEVVPDNDIWTTPFLIGDFSRMESEKSVNMRICNVKKEIDFLLLRVI